MGRPKSFDVDEVLDRAMGVFWLKGFEASSIEDLVSATGIQRQSLYGTFGDKRQLFLKALGRYREQGSRARAAILAEEAPIRVVLGRLLRRAVDNLEAHGRRGCLLVNAASDAPLLDPEIVELVRDNLKDMEESLWTCLQSAQDRGELGPHHDPRALARFFLNALYGLNTLGKVVMERDVLEDIVKVSLTILG